MSDATPFDAPRGYAPIRTVEYATLVGAHPSDDRPIDAVVAGELVGVRVRGLLDPDEVSTLLEHLEPELPGQMEPMDPARVYDQPGVQIALYGPLLEHAEDTELYLEQSAKWAQRSGPTNQLGIDQRVLAAVNALSSLECARASRDGRTFSRGTFRRLGMGGFISPHFELGVLAVPAIAETLGPLVRPDTIVSVLLTIRPAGEAGQLTFYDRLAEDEPEDVVQARYAAQKLDPSQFRSHAVALEAGDLLVFDAGRIFHGVSEVGSMPARWTYGGFAAVSRDERRLLLWG